MFVRFRQQSRHRLQVSLIETRSIDGKARFVHVASLGTVGLALSAADRTEFWHQLHERLGQLSNRIDAAALRTLLGDIHARIPMVTVEERRALQLENTKADARFWDALHNMHRTIADEHRQLLATVEQAIAIADAGAKRADERARVAKRRVRRFRDRKVVAVGLACLSPSEIDRLFYESGWTAKDRELARAVAEIIAFGGFEELLEEIHKGHRRAEQAAARTVLRRHLSAPAPRPSTQQTARQMRTAPARPRA